MNLPGPALWDVFTDGSQIVEDNGHTVEAMTMEAGSLTLPTGRIVAADPLLDPWMPPFSVRVRPGAYPVFVCIVREDVAAVLVRFNPKTPVSWQQANPGEFGVDSGTGCLMDAKVNRYLRRQADAGKYNRYFDRFRSALDENGGLWSNYLVHPESGANVVLFHTWGGDCAPSTYFGYSANKSVCCLVSDMFLSFEKVMRVDSA